MRKAILLVALGLITASATQALAADEPENVVKYRQSVMRALGGHAGAIAGVVKGEVGFVPHVAAHARGINDMSKLIADLFPQGTGEDAGLETRALPDIWKDQDKFKAAVDKLQAESAKLVEVAANGDAAAIGAQFQNVGKACGGCHKPFRAEKK